MPSPTTPPAGHPQRARPSPWWAPTLPVLAVLAVGTAIPAHAGGGAPGERPDASACPTLAKAYRGLEEAVAVPAAERGRIAALILEACGGVEIRVLRASTLDGAPVLEMPLPGFTGGERRP